MIDQKAESEDVSLIWNNINTKKEFTESKAYINEICNKLREEIELKFSKLEQASRWNMEDKTTELKRIQKEEFEYLKNASKSNVAGIFENMQTTLEDSIKKKSREYDEESFGKQSSPFKKAREAQREEDPSEDSITLYKNYLKKRPIEAPPEKDDKPPKDKPLHKKKSSKAKKGGNKTMMKVTVIK